MKHISLVILGITALICSRALFVFFNDPEGPNLLVVLVTAAMVYAASLATYMFLPVKIENKKLVVAVLAQPLVVAGLYLALR